MDDISQKNLGVPDNASDQDIKAAYWPSAEQNHPDINPGRMPSKHLLRFIRSEKN